ncbi:MAG: enoyl-CoA hydratase/isomerase family protein [Dehalococcoidia bacterium]|nr:enoyl-CoA hydratase/isomerase family protein [Dehalococcoidia bacterium]
MPYETVLVTKDAAVATVTLNRPERLNAFNGKMSAEVGEAFLALEGDPEVRAIVLTGAGRGFSAGLDMQEAGAQRGSGAAGRAAIALPMAKLIRQMRKPVIAAINGVAYGMGFTIPLCCDMRLAAEEAKISLFFTRAGLIPELGSTYLLPRLIGMGRALELCCTGRTIDGKEAERLGLVNKAVPLAKLPEAVKELTDQILECAPMAVAMAKKGLYQGSVSDLDAALTFESMGLAECFKSEDHMEYVQSFREKRKPVFKGR